MGLFSSRFPARMGKGMSVWGGGLGRGSLSQFSGYSAIAQCTGKPAFNDSLQKPAGGLSTEPFFGLYIVPLNKGAIEKNRTTDGTHQPLKLLYTSSTMLILERHG